MLTTIFQALQNRFNQLQVRQKILLGVGSLVLLGILVVMSFYFALRVSDNALHRVANEEEPISAAAYEMSINIANSGSTVINFLRTGDEYYRKSALQEKVDFETELARYAGMANNEKERTFANQVNAQHTEYWELGELLMQERSELELSLAITLEQIGLTKDVLDEGIAKLSSRPSTTDRRLYLQKMQASLKKMADDLRVYLRVGQVISSQAVEDEAEQFIVQLGYYQDLNLGKIESNRALRLASLFDESHQSIKKTIGLHDVSEEKLQQFDLIQSDLNYLLSKQMVPVAKTDLEEAKLNAERVTHAVNFWALLIAPIGLGLSLFVIYLLSRSVTRPTKQLVAGASALREGNLEYRIPDLGADELGVLGRQFNRMAERLQKTTVSRDKLEESEAALRVSQERYSRALSGTNDGIFDWDLVTNKVYYSPRWKNMLGYGDAQITPNPESYFSLVHEDDVELLRHNINAYIKRPGENLVNEHRVLHSDGEYRWMLFRAVASGQNSQQRATRLSGSQTDIDAQKKAEQQLIHDAMHDRLTGLPNRHLLLDRLQHFLDNTRRRQTEISALLFMDLDGFKLVNDSLGHAAGDRLLIAMAHRLSKILKPTDTLARFGGDEFVILSEELKTLDEVELVAEQIHQALELPFETRNGKTFLGASIGVALSTGYKRADDMLRDADIAMYRAKSQGKKRHVVFDQVMHGHVVERLALENELRQALENEELEIHYQPIIDLQGNRKLVGFEALLRWNHPHKGLIYPDDFIPLLEESGYIIEVGQWLLTKACTTLKSWHQKNYTPWISVNVSAVQLRDSGLVTTVAKALEDSQLAPRFLTLEITESNVMKNEVLARGLLAKIKQMGIKLSMDDFGVGYSSLSYLKRFPWDYVKIDRSFVRDIANDPEAASIIEAIIVMVHSLKFDVVAEGVETIEQLHMLKEYGIDCVQGYLLSRPEKQDQWNGLTSISSKRFLKEAFEIKSSLS